MFGLCCSNEIELLSEMYVNVSQSSTPNYTQIKVTIVFKVLKLSYPNAFKIIANICESYTFMYLEPCIVYLKLVPYLPL